MCDDEDKLLGTFKVESLRVYYEDREYHLELQGWWQRPGQRGQNIRITGSAREDFSGRGLTVRAQGDGDKLNEDDPITALRFCGEREAARFVVGSLTGRFEPGSSCQPTKVPQRSSFPTITIHGPF